MAKDLAKLLPLAAGVSLGHAIELAGEYYQQKRKEDTTLVTPEDKLLFGFEARSVVSYGGGAAAVALGMFMEKQLGKNTAEALVLAGLTAITGRAARQIGNNITLLKNANVSQVRSYSIPQRNMSAQVFQSPRQPQRDLDVRVD